jgi:hypothetical protein
LTEEVQYLPELLVQVVEPQSQSALFTVLPAVFAQSGFALQELSEEVQYLPELLVQVVEPQSQSALFSVLPAVFGQIGKLQVLEAIPQFNPVPTLVHVAVPQ